MQHTFEYKRDDEARGKGKKLWDPTKEDKSFESLKKIFTDNSSPKPEEIQTQYEQVAGCYGEFIEKKNTQLLSPIQNPLSRIIENILPDSNTIQSTSSTYITDLTNAFYHYLAFYHSFKSYFENNHTFANNDFLDKAENLIQIKLPEDNTVLKRLKLQLQQAIDVMDDTEQAVILNDIQKVHFSNFRFSKKPSKLWIFADIFYFLMSAGKLLIRFGNWIENQFNFSRPSPSLYRVLAVFIGIIFRFVFFPESLIDKVNKHQTSKNRRRLNKLYFKLLNIVFWVLIGIFFPPLLAPLLNFAGITLTAGIFSGVFSFAEPIGISALEVASAVATGIYMLIYNLINWPNTQDPNNGHNPPLDEEDPLAAPPLTTATSSYSFKKTELTVDTNFSSFDERANEGANYSPEISPTGTGCYCYFFSPRPRQKSSNHSSDPSFFERFTSFFNSGANVQPQAQPQLTSQSTSTEQYDRLAVDKTPPTNPYQRSDTAKGGFNFNRFASTGDLGTDCETPLNEERRDGVFV